MSTNPKLKALRLRELLTLTLHSGGVAGPDGEPLPIRRENHAMRLSEAFARDDEQPDDSDILGLSQWTVLARNEVQRDLSGGLDSAAAAAQRAGKDLYAAVWPRPGRPSSDYYAVLPVSVLAKLISATES